MTDIVKGKIEYYIILQYIVITVQVLLACIFQCMSYKWRERNDDQNKSDMSIPESIRLTNTDFAVVIVGLPHYKSTSSQNLEKAIQELFAEKKMETVEIAMLYDRSGFEQVQEKQSYYQNELAKLVYKSSHDRNIPEEKQLEQERLIEEHKEKLYTIDDEFDGRCTNLSNGTAFVSFKTETQACQCFNKYRKRGIIYSQTKCPCYGSSESLVLTFGGIKYRLFCLDHPGGDRNNQALAKGSKHRGQFVAPPTPQDLIRKNWLIGSFGKLLKWVFVMVVIVGLYWQAQWVAYGAFQGTSFVFEGKDSKYIGGHESQLRNLSAGYIAENGVANSIKNMVLLEIKPIKDPMAPPLNYKAGDPLPVEWDDPRDMSDSDLEKLKKEKGVCYNSCKECYLASHGYLEFYNSCPDSMNSYESDKTLDDWTKAFYKYIFIALIALVFNWQVYFPISWLMKLEGPKTLTNMHYNTVVSTYRIQFVNLAIFPQQIVCYVNNRWAITECLFLSMTIVLVMFVQKMVSCLCCCHTCSSKKSNQRRITRLLETNDPSIDINQQQLNETMEPDQIDLNREQIYANLLLCLSLWNLLMLPFISIFCVIMAIIHYCQMNSKSKNFQYNHVYTSAIAQAHAKFLYFPNVLLITGAILKIAMIFMINDHNILLPYEILIYWAVVLCLWILPIWRIIEMFYQCQCSDCCCRTIRDKGKLVSYGIPRISRPKQKQIYVEKVFSVKEKFKSEIIPAQQTTMDDLHQAYPAIPINETTISKHLNVSFENPQAMRNDYRSKISDQSQNNMKWKSKYAKEEWEQADQAGQQIDKSGKPKAFNPIQSKIQSRIDRGKSPEPYHIEKSYMSPTDMNFTKYNGNDINRSAYPGNFEDQRKIRTSQAPGFNTSYQGSPNRNEFIGNSNIVQNSLKPEHVNSNFMSNNANPGKVTFFPELSKSSKNNSEIGNQNNNNYLKNLPSFGKESDGQNLLPPKVPNTNKQMAMLN